MASSAAGGELGMPIRLAVDSMDVLRLGSPFRVSGTSGAPRLGVDRIHTISGRGRTILAAPPGVMQLGGTEFPVVGSSAFSLAVGNADQYKIQVYDRTARILHEIAGASGPRYLTQTELDSMEAFAVRRNRSFTPADRRRLSTLPQKYFHQLGFESKNRLWVFRLGPDPAAVDIFASAEQLGTLMIPCQFYTRSVVLHGDRLAVFCVDRNRDSGGYLRLYRVGG